MEPKIIQKRYTCKAQATDTPGEFEAIVSVFGNRDLQGDVTDAGAFEKTIKAWKESGNSMPVIFAHQWGNLESWLGVYKDMQETDEGLKLVGQLDVDEHPPSKRAHQMMKAGALNEFSFSGRVTKEEMVKVDTPDGEITEYHLKEIDLWEAGPVFKGANPETQLLSVKSAGGVFVPDHFRDVVATKEGRVLAQKYVDSLQNAHTELGAVLAAVSKQNDDDEAGKSGDKPPAVKQQLDINVAALLSLSTVDIH